MVYTNVCKTSRHATTMTLPQPILSKKTSKVSQRPTCCSVGDAICGNVSLNVKFWRYHVCWRLLTPLTRLPRLSSLLRLAKYRTVMSTKTFTQVRGKVTFRTDSDHSSAISLPVCGNFDLTGPVIGRSTIYSLYWAVCAVCVRCNSSSRGALKT